MNGLDVDLAHGGGGIPYTEQVSSKLVKTRPTGLGRAKGIVSSRKSGDRVRAWRYAASEQMSQTVECYWAGQWDLRGQAEHHNEMIPDSCAHLVVEQGGPMQGARWVGVWTKRWTRTLAGRGRVWGIKLRAGAHKAFGGQPAHRLRNQIVPLSELGFEECEGLVRKLVSSTTHEEAFEFFERWLAPYHREPDAGMTQAMRAIELLNSMPELLRAEQWAQALGLSLRALQRLFREHVGASPKWVLRKTRLQEAALELERQQGSLNPSSLSEIAHRFGYSDHAHFCRDFKQVVNKSPSDFLKSIR